MNQVSTVYWITASFLGDVPYLMNQSLWIEASPSTYIKPDAPIFVIVHGTNDTVVPIAVSESFKNKLEAAGVETHFVRVEGGDHFILTTEEENLQVRYALEPVLKRVFNLRQEETFDFSGLIVFSLVLISALFVGLLFRKKRASHRGKLTRTAMPFTPAIPGELELPHSPGKLLSHKFRRSKSGF